MRVKAFLIGLGLVCLLAGPPVALRAYDHSTAAKQRTFLRLLSDSNGSGDPRLTAEVHEHPDAVIAAGNRACDWAQSHRQYPYDYRLRARYDQTDHPPDLGAGMADADIAGYIAETAWDHLCPMHFVGGDD